jgi:hypothetical protein
MADNIHGQADEFGWRRDFRGPVIHWQGRAPAGDFRGQVLDGPGQRDHHTPLR